MQFEPSEPIELARDGTDSWNSGPDVRIEGPAPGQRASEWASTKDPSATFRH